MSSDEVEKNTTLVTTPKIRWTGRTGVVDKVFFDHVTRRLINYQDCLNGGVSKTVNDVEIVAQADLEDDVEF